VDYSEEGKDWMLDIDDRDSIGSNGDLHVLDNDKQTIPDAESTYRVRGSTSAVHQIDAVDISMSEFEATSEVEKGLNPSTPNPGNQLPHRGWEGGRFKKITLVAR
jgi:hypothetical protein